MTKADIIKSVAKTTGIDTTMVEVVVNGFISTVRSAINKKDNIYLRGLGTFAIVRRKAKLARDITKNKPVMIPEHDVVAFRPSKDIKL